MFLCLSGPMMWWRRRPKGSGALGAPRGKMPFKASPLVLVLAAVVLGVLLPLFGVSLLVALILDQLVLRRVPALSGVVRHQLTTDRPPPQAAEVRQAVSQSQRNRRLGLGHRPSNLSR